MSEISSKYPFLAMANMLGGGFLVVVVFAWAPTTAAWLGFAISIPLAVFGLAMAFSAGTGPRSAERRGVAVIGMLTWAIASWTIIASLVFRPVRRALADLRQCLRPRGALDGDPRYPRSDH